MNEALLHLLPHGNPKHPSKPRAIMAVWQMKKPSQWSAQSRGQGLNSNSTLIPQLHPFISAARAQPSLKNNRRFWREPEEGGRDGTSGGLFWQHHGVLLKTRRFSAPAHLVYGPMLLWVLAKADKPHVPGPWDWMIHIGTAAVGASEYAEQGVPVTGVISCIDSSVSTDTLGPETDSPAACFWCLHFHP